MKAYEKHIRIVSLAVLSLLVSIIGYTCTSKKSDAVVVPILVYHDISDTDVPVTLFEEQLQAILDAGYNAVSLDDLCAFVNEGIKLPPRPIVFTFDDGYVNNIDNALPVLQSKQIPATIYVIGSSMGLSLYKDRKPMIPHFDLNAACSAEATGIVSIGSHSFDMHQVEGRDISPVRAGVLPVEGESVSEWQEFLHEDCLKFKQKIDPALGHAVVHFAYPYGKYSDSSEELLGSEGYLTTVTFDEGVNIITQGQPDTLKLMRRISIYGNTLSGTELVNLVNKFVDNATNK